MARAFLNGECRFVTPVEKIPRALAEKFAAIKGLTDAFCETHLSDEYRVLIHGAIGSLARKRPSPLLRGKESTWAAAVVHAVGKVNFLDDRSQVPHCESRTLFEYFGVAPSTGQSKSREIRETLQMGPMSPAWTLPSRLADNPFVWMLEIDGLVIDIRLAPPELQQLAYEKGLIPFLPTGNDRAVHELR
jgi:hypothetical protein